MHTIIGLHRRAVDAVRPLVAAVTPADLDRPTPCADWDLRALLAHMIGQDHGFAAAVRADVTAEAFAPRAPSPAAHARSADLVVTAFAAAPDRQVLLPELAGRRFPLPVVIGFHLVDTLVHGWDVAASLGTGIDYPADLVTAALRQAEHIPDGPTRTAPGAPFAPALPTAADAPDWHRTLTLLGRDPHWTARSAENALPQ
ncbi:TIGR03086 family metal-binding protein [Saccharothrix obliqua]|uniref:TIGR03086 family metal-binding protein n=1 Tax=Saccharothrix obliqua TaxID=2861747 RepID=UPI001C5E8AF3|nr:TIGR03086 family metal-binding protein [Saccharothrix obliqua]MBW4720712.1 TIGR03086 family protein [Saccharothrix obliqua]